MNTYGMTLDEKQTAVREALSTIIDALNNVGSAKEVEQAILGELRFTHRTLQQKFWGSMLRVQMEYANGEFDLRNEASVKLAKAVAAAAREHNFDLGLPHV